MPKELLAARSLDAGTDANGVHHMHHRALQVNWGKNGREVVITPAYYRESLPGREVHPDAARDVEAFKDEAVITPEMVRPDGWCELIGYDRAMDWGQLNDLIRILKRARDDAFGRPE